LTDVVLIPLQSGKGRLVSHQKLVNYLSESSWGWRDGMWLIPEGQSAEAALTALRRHVRIVRNFDPDLHTEAGHYVRRFKPAPHAGARTWMIA
jgi:hypothetical protein